MSKIAKKYYSMLGMKVPNLMNTLGTHKRSGHKDKVPNQVWGAKMTNNNAPSLEGDRKKMVSFEVAAEQLLAIGMKEAETLSPKDALALAAQLQKTHLEGRKVRVSEDALKLTAAKFFGGFLSGSVQEGEVLPDGVNTSITASIESEDQD